jgi:hypothetical protein
MILTLIIKRGIGIRILKHDSDFELKNAPQGQVGIIPPVTRVRMIKKIDINSVSNNYNQSIIYALQLKVALSNATNK